MSKTITFLLLASCASSGLSAELLQEDLLGSGKWLESCRSIRDELNQKEVSKLRYLREVRLSSSSDYRIEIDGLAFGLPFGAASFSKIEPGSSGGGYLFEKDSRNYLVLSSDISAVSNSYWEGESSVSLSSKIFGEHVSFDALRVESFNFTPDDLHCRPETKYEDARIIAMLDSKMSLRVINATLENIYRIDESGWEGYFFCSQEDESANFDFSVISKGKSLTGGGRFDGQCSEIVGGAESGTDPNW